MTFFILSFAQLTYPQKSKSDANIFGHVICLDCNEHISFATVFVKGTTIGTTTDETGHYQLINLPEGTHIIMVRAMGHKPVEKEITIKNNETKEVNFELEQDVLKIEEITVTGDRNETRRRDATIIVNTLRPNLFETAQSATISEGLNFCPGLRFENNCQNCGFSQVRMNGMEGPYSQILINGRPIFSGLAGVYGLELIPANMIERIEVIRGGGSALYGSNAIAGTINLILKDPIKNSYEFGINTGLVGLGSDKYGNPANDHSVNFNTSLVSADNKTGMSLYGFYRDRKPFDANNDNFSELSSINNTTIGTRFYHRFGMRNKFTADLFTIKEDRRGGDRFDYPLHEANIAESVKHNITTGGLTYEKFFRDYDLFSVYFSGQGIDRDSYYGAEMSLSDYGNTKDFSYSSGVQYNANLNNGSLIAGIENNGAWLQDKKLGYPDIENAVIIDGAIESIPHTDNVLIADQIINIYGTFLQYEFTRNKLKISAGARFDHYKIEDKISSGSAKTGNVLSPRLTLKYDIKDYLQARISYSQGYRAPQIFDEDLHIETSGSRKVIHKNDPYLKQETSQSYMVSLDFNKQIGKIYLGIMAEGFYTRLNDPFANEYGEPDENNTVVYTRINAQDGAKVKGINLEMNFMPGKYLTCKAGFTLQKSSFDEPQEFNEKEFFRTPEDYGYTSVTVKPSEIWALSFTGNYTGKMLIPYFGPELLKPEEGELRKSPAFFDFGMKLRYNIKLNGSTLQLFTGIKNLFNSYQKDFDTGIGRDPGYIYGPISPGAVYFGMKIGNFIRFPRNPN